MARKHRKLPQGSITHRFYDDVLSRNLRICQNIEDGRRIIAECPFCAAVDFNIGQGFYKCFACGKVGNALTFLVEVMKMSQAEALECYRKYE